MDAERSAFEAWAAQNDVSLRLSPDGTDYDYPGTRACWAAWWHLTNRAALAAQPAQAGEAVAWDGVQALIDAADKCADLMDAQERPVSSGGEEWDAALCELRERADALRSARINAWSPAPSRPGGATKNHLPAPGGFRAIGD